MKKSAGILLHRTMDGAIEVLLVHPGGPFWRRRDVGAWQIPKGEIDPGEEAETAARREVAEEIGVIVTSALTPLGEVRQAGGKLVIGYLAVADVDVATIVSDAIEIEWPRGSGRVISVPEIDEARWMGIADARRMMLKSQLPFLDRLSELPR